MRPRRLGPFLLLVACGDPPEPTVTASAGVTSVSASASGDPSTTSASTADPIPTTATSASEPTTGATSPTTTTGVGTSTDATSSDATTIDATTDDTTTGDTDGTSTGLTASTGSSGTTDACPIGQQGCPCGQNNTCAGDLECSAGVCQPPAPPMCGDGVVEGGELCDDGNKIDGDGCDSDCTPTQAPAMDPCGFPADDAVWLEIDYTSAFTPTNPKWTYSPTPGWGEADWAPSGESWPEVWDVFNNITVINDQIGKVALVDGNGALQIMFGIQGLTYDHATVCVQGRSYSVGSSVIFTVQNQLNVCGGTGMMANDWSIHSTGVDLGTCIVQGNEFQGLRIFASGGSGALSLTRLRFTLHGAVY